MEVGRGKHSEGLTKVIFKKMELNILSGDVIMYDFTFTTPDKELN